MNRRTFLMGMGGAFMALPFLEGLSPQRARATTGGAPFAIFIRQGNGVQQADADEPERFWPSFAPGAMTSSMLAADKARAVSVLADHAAHLTFVKGINFNDPANACRHSGGGNQVLTAAAVTGDPCNSTLAQGESLDNRIVREFGQPGDEPLTLYAGRKTGMLDEVLSYRGPKQLRAAERDPFLVYKKLFGLTNLAQPELLALQTSRKSVNDLVRSDMQRLLGRTDLSKDDTARLNLHFQSIRDVETRIACTSDRLTVDDLQAGAAVIDDDDQIDTVISLHCDIMVLAVTCGATRAATLQLGSGPDGTQYTISGTKLPGFHSISHRSASGIDNVIAHHQIDMKLLGFFKYLLDGLAQRRTCEGTLLDQGVAVYMSDLATGDHKYENVPYLVAGSAGGFLRTGRYVDEGGVTNNKLLNTIGAAVGCKNEAGQPLDDFGDPRLEKGLLNDLVSGASARGC